MTALTTRQRDLLRLLLDANVPLSMAAIAEPLQLTTRQVSYSLKGAQRWLDRYGATLNITPGVGVQLDYTDGLNETLRNALESDDNYQLILSPSQRQQLFVFHLLTSRDPLILFQLQQRAQVSRTTILKDLDSIEPWLQACELLLERRPNYGIEISGAETAKRNALVALLWGVPAFGDPLWHMTHVSGLVFDLSQDSALLPILDYVQQVVVEIKARAAIERVALAEAALGGRFGDVAVLHLALVFAVQQYRVHHGYFLKKAPGDALNELKQHTLWSVAQRIFSIPLRLSRPVQSAEERNYEIATVLAHLLGGTRNDRWPSDSENEKLFATLIAKLMEMVSDAYKLPDLLRDTTLRDGLIAHIIPACMRHKYQLWSPQQQTNRLQDTYVFEHALAAQLSDEIEQQTGTRLPEVELNNLALLIRAAYVRERPYRLQHVVVVCPSGMATAQLLTARLKARFPRLGRIEVLSMRELNGESLGSADLVLTTVPLGEQVSRYIKVIQVHPLLLPEDIETITQWIA